MATTPKADTCKAESSYWLRVTLLAVRMNAVKPLDLTLEVAPKARFDVVEMRSRFAAEHRALAKYSHCLYWSSHTTSWIAAPISTRFSARPSPKTPTLTWRSWPADCARA